MKNKKEKVKLTPEEKAELKEAIIDLGIELVSFGVGTATLILLTRSNLQFKNIKALGKVGNIILKTAGLAGISYGAMAGTRAVLEDDVELVKIVAKEGERAKDLIKDFVKDIDKTKEVTA